MSMKINSALIIVAIFGALISGDVFAQDMNRGANETPAQCTKRLFPGGYSVKNYNQCMKACAACYTTSGGGGCNSYCTSKAK